MINALFEALAAGLSIWDSHEKRKYIDRLMDLKRDYYEEFNKPVSERSDAALDHIERELCILGSAFATSVRVADAAPKP